MKRSPYLVVVDGVEYKRPETRAECADIPRPCTWFSCRYNLGPDQVEFRGSGSDKWFDRRERLRKLETWVEQGDWGETLLPSCVLDVIDAADNQPMCHEDIAVAINASRERTRQIDEKAMATLTDSGRLASLFRQVTGEEPEVAPEDEDEVTPEDEDLPLWSRH